MLIVTEILRRQVMQTAVDEDRQFVLNTQSLAHHCINKRIVHMNISGIMQEDLLLLFIAPYWLHKHTYCTHNEVNILHKNEKCEEKARH